MDRRILGRDAELDSVYAFLGDETPAPRALVIWGEAGIGKTTIWREGVRRARELGVRAPIAQPTESEASLPYAALADLLRDVPDDALERLPRVQSDAVAAAVARGEAAGPVDPHALARGLLEVLDNSASDGPLLVAIDDVQWLDGPTTAALTFALRRVGPARIRLFASMRTSPGPPSEPPLGVGSWEQPPRFLEVGPLAPTELGAVLRSRLGETLSRPRIEALARASGGSPMLALELARQETGASSAPPSLAEALATRIRDLDPGGRAAVTIASVALQPSVDFLVRAGVEERGIRSAVDGGILLRDGDRLAFAHPLLASAAYETLLPGEQRAVHERLVAVSSRPIERGHHVSRSAIAPSDAAVAALEDAAEEAAALGDHAGAAAFLLRAGELSPDQDGEDAQRRRVRAASELAMAGDTETAAELAGRLVDRLPPSPLRSLARQTLVSCSAGLSMPIGVCVRELELALADAEGDDELAASLHLSVADALSIMFSLERARDHLRSAVELAERAGADQLVVAALAEAGFEDSMLGEGVSDNAVRAYERWDGVPLSATVYSPRMVLACVRLHAAEFEEAARLFAEEIDMAEKRGLEAIEVVARGHLAEAQLRSGLSARALASARLAAEHAHQAANPQTIAGGRFVLAMVEAVLGNHDAARALSNASLQAAESAGDVWYTLSHRSVLGLVALAEDDWHEAITVLEPAWKLIREHGLGDLSIFPVAHVLGEAYVGAGRAEDAKTVVTALRTSPAGARPWSDAMAARCEALLAAAAGDHVGARLAVEAALAAHKELQEPFELARTLLVQGQVERRAKRRAVARDALTKALELFDALGAARWAEKAAAELARIPGRSRGSDVLTETERRVAELVAQGLANKEVAAQLFVSVRAVESNLSKVYAKLGIRSRTELAARMRLLEP